MRPWSWSLPLEVQQGHGARGQSLLRPPSFWPWRPSGSPLPSPSVSWAGPTRWHQGWRLRSRVRHSTTIGPRNPPSESTIRWPGVQRGRRCPPQTSPRTSPEWEGRGASGPISSGQLPEPPPTALICHWLAPLPRTARDRLGRHRHVAKTPRSRTLTRADAAWTEALQR